MKNKLFARLGLLALLLCLMTLNANAQRPRASAKPAAKPTAISAADQAAIQEIFKGVDPSKYRLQFNEGKQTLGAREVNMADLQQVKRVTNPAEAAGYIVFVVEGKDVIYVLAVGSKDLISVIGRQKAAKLNAIMAKYQ